MRRHMVLIVSVLLISMLVMPAGATSPHVTFADVNLERAVRDAIGKPLGPLSEQDVAGLVTLHANSRRIASLEGIEKLVGLKELVLVCNDIDSVDQLTQLRNLRLVDLRFNTKLDASKGSPARRTLDALTWRGIRVYYGEAVIKVEYASLEGKIASVCDYDGKEAQVASLIVASATDRSRDCRLTPTKDAIEILMTERKRPGVPIEGVFCFKESTLPSRWKWEAVNSRLPWEVAPGTKGIILIVHGWGSGHKNFTSIAEELAKDDWTVYAIDYPSGQRIEDVGAGLANLIDTCVPLGQKISILAHSMGGLVSRSAIEQHGVDGRVDKLLTLGTPHNGIPVEYFLNGYSLYSQAPPDTNSQPISSSVQALESNPTWFYTAARAAYTWRTGKERPFGLDALDMANLTHFLKGLNSPSPVSTVYYQLAGTEHPPLAPPPSDDATLTKQLADFTDEVFGALAYWAYDLQLPQKRPTDGVVPLASATYDLSGKQVHGEYLDWVGERVFTFPIHHRSFHLCPDAMKCVKRILASTTLSGTVMDGAYVGIGDAKIRISGWFLDSSAPDGMAYGATIHTRPDGSFTRPGYLGPTMVVSPERSMIPLQE